MSHTLRCVAHPLAVAVLAVVLSACQTFASRPKPSLPPGVQKLFGSCLTGDGAVAMQLYNDGVLQGSLETNWVAKGPGEWQVQMTDPLGRSLLQIHSHGTALDLSGPLAAKIQGLAVDADGMIAVEGHSTGIKVQEVPCLLSFVYPKAWLPALTERVDAGPKSRYVFAQAVRRLELEGAPAGGASCTDIFWHEYLILGRKLTWCMPATAKRSASLVGLQGYKLTWVRIDE